MDRQTHARTHRVTLLALEAADRRSQLKNEKMEHNKNSMTYSKTKWFKTKVFSSVIALPATPQGKFYYYYLNPINTNTYWPKESEK